MSEKQIIIANTRDSDPTKDLGIETGGVRKLVPCIGDRLGFVPRAMYIAAYEVSDEPGAQTTWLPVLIETINIGNVPMLRSLRQMSMHIHTDVYRDSNTPTEVDWSIIMRPHNNLSIYVQNINPVFVHVYISIFGRDMTLEDDEKLARQQEETTAFLEKGIAEDAGEKAVLEYRARVKEHFANKGTS